MLNFLLLLLVVGAGVGAYMYFRSHKLAKRLKHKFGKAEDSLADKVGNVIDDREIKIKEGKETYEEITDALVEVMTNIEVEGERVEKFLNKAEKFTKIAKNAKNDGNLEAAKEALSTATVAEESAKAFKRTLENLEKQAQKLNEKRDRLNNSLENAEANTAIFEARYSAAELERKMLTSDAFGGVDNLNFDDDDEVLRKLEAKNRARASLDSEPESALSEYEKNVNDDELLAKLEKL